MTTLLAAQPGEGTLLSVMISSTLTPIGLIYEIDGPKVLVEAIDCTILAGPLILTRPSRFPEPDKVTLKMWMDQDDAVGLALIQSDLATPKPAGEAFVIQFNDAHITTHALCAFSGFFTSGGVNGMKKGSNLGYDVEIQMTTLPTFTPGTG